jgi:4-amino-4-deoxy-L-arabinose transferase-like glycosyltransferase
MSTSPSRLRIDRRAIVLIILAVAIAFGFQGSRGLYETTEGRYAEAAREMIETGDWLVPQLDYEPHWAKPPLTYWAIAGGMLLLGENEWGVRAASAVSYLVIVWAVFGLASSMWGRRTGFAAALVYATAPLAALGVAGVSTDPILAMWEALAALAYWRALKMPDSRASRRWVVLFWIVVGLGFLTKGPPALLTLLAVLIYHGLRRATGRFAPALASATGLILFALIGLGWYVAMALREQGLLVQLLREEVVDRVASERFRRNPEWYHAFLVIILPFVLGLGAWLGFVPGAWRVWRRRIAGSSWRRELTRREALLFCVLWVAAPLLVLSLSKSRLPLYVLPFLPGAALIVGRGITVRWPARERWSAPIVVAISSAIVLVAAKGVAGRLEVSSDIRPVYEHVRRASRGAPTVYGYGLEQEHGLAFYLKGRLVRVSRNSGEPWAAMDREEFLDHLLAAGRERTAYAVARRGADELAEALTDRGLRHSEEEVSTYTVFAIEPASSGDRSSSRAGERAGDLSVVPGIR